MEPNQKKALAYVCVLEARHDGIFSQPSSEEMAASMLIHGMGSYIREGHANVGDDVISAALAHAERMIRPSLAEMSAAHARVEEKMKAMEDAKDAGMAQIKRAIEAALGGDIRVLVVNPDGSMADVTNLPEGDGN